MTTDAVVVRPSVEELEAPEVAGYRDVWSAVPADVRDRFGVRHTDVAGTSCTAVDALPGSRLMNHALGLTGLTPGRLEAVERFYDERAIPALLALPEGDPGEQMLRSRGYRPTYAWVKFMRRATPARPAAAPVDVRPVEPSEAERMGTILSAGFDLPAAFAPWFGALVGRPGWHCLGAYDAGRLVATGSLYVHARAGWITWAATDAAHRGRGAQQALLAARIEAARRLGLDLLVVETGEREEGRVDASYRNILAAGFEPVFRRPFWRRDEP